VLRRHRADHDIIAVGTDTFEIGNTAEVDQIGRRGEAKLHHRDETVAAGERAAVVAQLCEQTNGFGNGRRTMIGESAWYHGHPPWRRCPAKVATQAVRDSAQYL
jgi:hypothetical protein